MKKISLLLIVCLLLLTGCNKKDTKKVRTDALKFKEEYSLSIDNNPIVYTNIDKVLDIIKNKKGVIYLGYPSSNSCKDMVPILLEAAKQTGLKKIYYLNTKDMDNEELKNYVNDFNGINVLFKKENEDVYSVSSLDKDYHKMSDNESEELLKIYRNSIHEVLDDLCDQSC